MRRRLVIGNWKMNLGPGESATLASALLEASPTFPSGVTVALAPSFPCLERVGRILASTPLALAAQDVSPEKKGAFTGDVSASMLRDTGATFVLVGHSERRQYHGETEKDLFRKITRLLEAGLAPVYCVGETLEERDAGRTEELLSRQLSAFDAFSQPPAGLVLAYEPVWAIGTGRAATPEMAQEVHRRLRELMARRYGPQLAAGLPILYGGSVTAANAAPLFEQSDIDGGLVGGASLSSTDFASIVRAAAPRA